MRFPHALLAVVALALAWLAPVAPAKAQFLAGQLENLLSTPDRTVRVQGLSGVLSGNLRIQEVTVADRDGVWLTARDLALDWSPLALVRKNVSVENLTAGQITLARLPLAGQTPAESSEGGFSLPSITADIRNIQVNEFALGEAVAGVSARLAAQGSLRLSADPAVLDANLAIRRLDQPGEVNLKLGFEPANNRLEIAMNASEPAGGLVAGLLKIPGAPPVALSIQGNGPLDAFSANGTLDLGSERAATLQASTQNGGDGRRVQADLTALTAPFVPEAYLGTVGRDLRLQANVLLRPDGAIAIDTGRLVSGNLDLTAQGVLDRSGSANDLTVALRTDEGNPIPIVLGEAGARTAIDLSRLDARLQGAFSAAAVELSAAARSAGYADYAVNELTASASSTAFDLNNIAGPLQLQADARSASVPAGIATRVLQGPISLRGQGALTADGIGLDSASLKTAVAELSLAGQAALNVSTFALDIQSRFQTEALAADAVPYVGPSVAIAGRASRAADGSFALSDFRVDGDALDLSGTASLTGETIAAAVSGRLNQAVVAGSGLDGEAEFKLDASGTTAAPAIDLTATAARLDVAGRRLENLDARIQGTFPLDAPAGTVAVNGTYDGAPLRLAATLATEGGVRRLTDLVLRQNRNRVEGSVALDDENRATGQLRLDLPDAAPLLALAGQTGAGTLNGTVNLAVGSNGTPTADLDLAAPTVTLNGNSLTEARIRLRATDYLQRPQVSGTVRAAEIEAGSLTVSRLDAALEAINRATAVNASLRLNGVPTELSGDVAFTDAGTVVELRRLAAQVPNAPLSLAEPATVTLGSVRTTISRVLLNAGSGSLELSGSAGDTLDLDLSLNRLPVALANPFVADLDASGTLTGTAALKGSASSPDVDFSLRAADVETRQTRQARLAPVEANLQGRLRDGTATLDAARVSLGSGTIDASGTVGETLDLDLALTNLPVALANGFREGLGASGRIDGTATATGSIANPAVRFDLTGADITATDVARAGVPPLRVEIAGLYRGSTVRLDRALATVGSGRIEATGSIGRDLDLDLTIAELPAALANGFVQGLDARGTISGSAKATGSIADPTGRFELASRGLSAAPLRRAGIEEVRLDLAGTIADSAVRFERGTVQVGDGSLQLSGTLGRTLDLRLALDRLPLAIADAVRPDLGARGTLSGEASATGTLSNPSARFDVTARGVSVAQGRQAGAPPIDAVARGSYSGGTLQLETAQLDLGSGRVTASGSVGQRLDLNADIRGVPVSLAAAVVPDLAPTGTLDGTVRATGSVSAPAVDYDLRVASLSLQPTREAGVGPLDVAARGTYSGTRVTVDGTLSGDGLQFSANGSVGLAGTPSFDLALNGTAPLALANRTLATGGRSVSGVVRVDARVTGTAAAPNVTGTVTTSGATFNDTGANVSLENIQANIALNGQSATIQSLTANVRSGGTVRVSGTVGFGNGFPADLTINGDQVRYADGEFATVRLDASLRLTGPLTGDALLSGTVNTSEINIQVPENLPTSLAQIDLKRRNTPPAVLRQLREINPDSGSGGTGGSGGIRLDVTVNAPNRVFVRGRGLDLELGGTIRVQGPVSGLGVSGGFELQRGRFQLLSRRLDFSRATLTFNGDLVPTLDLLASSDTGDGVTVNVAITGPANAPSFSFTSTPALPQDEVLARLVFGQGTANLSPLQIAQLASAAAQLAGVGGSTGLLDNLRSQLGVDDIDIRTTADGQAAVGVGRYLNDNTYVGVDSTGRVSIDLELGADIKARAAVGANGGEVGVFYEREYGDPKP
ncbi:translocation/assembly module TamB domain-containing protein [Aureimonas sp. AU4]|uniref:translocation/assembly module TamB domain-containing protein n=1 Tax=Aureimonas sp. AU4 TaxID=1638163 RepID=UPI0007839315|nr:translocation/assembly module TamB domain-containing protein [Aureimonas sp. AU4]